MSGELAQVTGNLTGNLVFDFNLGSTVSFLNIKQASLGKKIVLLWTDGAIGRRFAFRLQFYSIERVSEGVLPSKNRKFYLRAD